jgi:hypothetical protein
MILTARRGTLRPAPTIAATPATNLIVNGTFDSDANWSGFWFSGKSVSGGKAVFANAPAYDGINQAVALTAGKYYEATITISNYTAGEIRTQITADAGGFGLGRAADGTFTDWLLASSEQSFYLLPGGAGFSGSVDVVALVGPYNTAVSGA